MFLRFWLFWSFGYDMGTYDKLGSGPIKRPTGPSMEQAEEEGLYGLFSNSSKTTLPNVRPLWICTSLPYSDFPPKRPSKVGYWRTKFDPDSLESLVRKLRDWRFSLAIKNEVLYYSNSLSASYGLPPNAEHVGLFKVPFVPNFALLGGAAVVARVELSGVKATVVKDAMGQFANSFPTTSYGEWVSTRNRFEEAFSVAGWTDINLFCFELHEKAHRFEPAELFLWVDSTLRRLVGRSGF
jgi:hypothetical protein